MQKAVDLPASINSTSHRANLPLNKFGNKFWFKIFTQFPLLTKHILASLGPGFALERQMLILVQRLSECVQFSFFTALCWRAAQALSAAASGASHRGRYVLATVYSLSFLIFFWRKQQTLIVTDTLTMFLSSAQLSESSFLCGVWFLCRGGVCISEHANLYFISKQVCKSFC